MKDIGFALGELGYEVSDRHLRAYIDGRNAARQLQDRNPPKFSDDLETVNWEVGYDDAMIDLMEGS